MLRDTILAIDQGTPSSRVILFGLGGEVLQSFQHELASSYPQSGWVEQDANSIWDDVFRLCSEAVTYAKLNNLRIASMGITNQRETVVFFDKTTHLALSSAIVWARSPDCGSLPKAHRCGTQRVCKAAYWADNRPLFFSKQN